MITVIGEALVDEFPDSNRIGGAPLNFAVHVHHLGQPVRLITRVGADTQGQAILAELGRRGLDVSGVQVDAEKPTGTVRVTLADDGTPRYDILTDVAYDAIAPPAQIQDSRLVYFGTLAQRSAGAFDRIQRFLQGLPHESDRFLDINLRSGNYTQATVEGSLQRTDLLKLNQDELETLGEMLFPQGPHSDLPQRLMDRYAIQRVFLTCGDRGAAVFTREGERYTTAAVSVPALVDSVGAGDAFAAVLAVGWMRKLAPGRVLAAAAAFAAHVCGLSGALPSDLHCYREISGALGDLKNA
jgi:fructokinase